MTVVEFLPYCVAADWQQAVSGWTGCNPGCPEATRVSEMYLKSSDFFNLKPVVMALGNDWMLLECALTVQRKAELGSVADRDLLWKVVCCVTISARCCCTWPL